MRMVPACAHSHFFTWKTGHKDSGCVRFKGALSKKIYCLKTFPKRKVSERKQVCVSAAVTAGEGMVFLSRHDRNL